MLGAAWIAGRAVLPAIEASRNGRVVAIASRDPKRAHAFAAANSGARVSDTYEALLQDPHVDAVYIPLVNNLHKEWTLKAMAAGKHVLCEKPLGMNAAEAEEMAAVAEDSRMHLMEAFMYRFHPRMRDFVAGVRDPMYVQASFGFLLEDKANYRLQAELGGGALLDVGCYTVSVARWILGEPNDVFARAHKSHGRSRHTQVDLSVGAMLHFKGGQTASLWASIESPEQQELTVVTPEGVNRLERPFTWMEQADPYQLMVESFADSVLNGRPVAIPPSESIANLKVLDRIRRAAGLPAS